MNPQREELAPDGITVKEEEEESEFVKIRKGNWARLIRKVWMDDPALRGKT